MAAQRLIGIRYWRNLYEPALPDPAWFVDEQWSSTERQRTVDYLRKGEIIFAFGGYSWCRFRCGENDSRMGACELTDGIYCWPEGLAHYVEKHAIRLPDAIIQHILTQKIALDFNPDTLESFEPNYEWWMNQKGSHTSANSFLSGSDKEEVDYLRNYDRGYINFDDYSEPAQEERELLAQMLRKQHSR